MISNIITSLFLNKIFIIVIDIIAISLAFIVLKNNPKGKLNRIYLLMTLSMLGWVNFAYIPRAIDIKYYDLGLISLKIAWFVTPLFFMFLYLLSFNLAGKEEKYKFATWFVIVMSLLLAFITGFTNLVISGFQVVSGVTTIIYGNYKIPFLVGILFIVIATVISLFINKKIFQERKMQYFSFGLFIFLFLNAVFNIILPMFFGISQFYFLGDYSTLILLAFISYAIVKHSLFGIKIVVTQLIVVIFLSLLILNFLSSNSLVQYMWSGIVLIVASFFSYLIMKSMLKEIRAHKLLLSETQKDLEKEKSIHKKLVQKTGELIKKMEEIVQD